MLNGQARDSTPQKERDIVKKLASYRYKAFIEPEFAQFTPSWRETIIGTLAPKSLYGGKKAMLNEADSCDFTLGLYDYYSKAPDDVLFSEVLTSFINHDAGLQAQRNVNQDTTLSGLLVQTFVRHVNPFATIAPLPPGPQKDLFSDKDASWVKLARVWGSNEDNFAPPPADTSWGNRFLYSVGRSLIAVGRTYDLLNQASARRSGKGPEDGRFVGQEVSDTGR